MVALTRIFLYNWHQFRFEILDVEQTGQVNGIRIDTWASLLDAVKLVLIADRSDPNGRNSDHIQHNEPSNYANDDEADELSASPSSDVSYIVLEWTNTDDHQDQFMVGVCHEHTGYTESSNLFFIIPGKLETEWFVTDGHPLNRQYLRQTLRTIPDASSYRKPADYRSALLNRLGGINARLFDMLQRSASFQPLCDVRNFVMQWLLEVRPLDVETLQRLAAPYTRLSTGAREVEEKLMGLRAIVQRQSECINVRDHHAQYMVLIVLLRQKAARQQVTNLEAQVQQLAQQIEQAQTDKEAARTTRVESQAHLQQVEEQLRQSSFTRRSEQIERDIKELSSEASIIQSRWLTLLHDFKQLESAMRPLFARGQKDGSVHEPHTGALILTCDERLRVLHFLDGCAALTAERPPDRSFASLVDDAIAVCDAALPRVRAIVCQMTSHLDDLREQGRLLHINGEHMRQGKRTYPANVERVCTLLTHVIGERPPLLCEVIEVPDQRWQDAVEALLGEHRFTILVQSAYFDVAIKVLDQVRLNENIYGIHILNVAGTLRKVAPSPPGSLVDQVHPLFPSLRPLLDIFLGDIIACHSFDDVFRHRCAVTPDVIVYRDSAVRILSPETYRPWFIGDHALKLQWEANEEQLRHVKDQIENLSRFVQAATAYETGLQRVRQLAVLRQRLESPLDERPLRDQIADLIARQKGLDTGDVDALRQEIERLREVIEQSLDTEYRLTTTSATWKADKHRYEHDLREARKYLRECTEQAVEARATYAPHVAAAEQELTHYLPDAEHTYDQRVYHESIRNLERTARMFDARLGRELQQLTRDAIVYNMRYNFMAQTDNPDEHRYADEAQRLIDDELPLYKDQIDLARRGAMDVLRDYVLLPLQERVMMVEQQLEQFNEALALVDIHNKRYRLWYRPDDELIAYYNLISQSQQLVGKPMLESDLYLSYKSLCDQLYAILTSTPRSEDHRLEQERLLDYRSYFAYSVEFVHNGTMNTQPDTPPSRVKHADVCLALYVIIAASFVQLYQGGDRHKRSTIRLVLFQESFASLDRESSIAIRAMYETFGLQVLSLPESI